MNSNKFFKSILFVLVLGLGSTCLNIDLRGAAAPDVSGDGMDHGGEKGGGDRKRGRDGEYINRIQGFVNGIFPEFSSWVRRMSRKVCDKARKPIDAVIYYDSEDEGNAAAIAAAGGYVQGHGLSRRDSFRKLLIECKVVDFEKYLTAI